MSSGRTRSIPVDKIVVPDIRVSAKFTDEQQAFFKASIEKLGVVQDPVVRPLPDGRYEVIAGAHRIRELQEQGAKEIICKVVEVGDKIAIEMNIVENLARGSYDPMEVSKQLNNYLEKGGTIEGLVRLTGHTRSWVEKYLSLVNLPPEFQYGLSEGYLRIGHIEEAFRLSSETEIYDALKTAMTHRWSVEILRNYVNNRLTELEEYERLRSEGLAPPAPPKPRPELADIGECFGCRRKLLRKELRLPQICGGCLTLLRYCTSQLGEPQKAMERIYEAVSFKTRYEEWQRYRFAEFEKAEHERRAQPFPGPGPGYPPKKPPIKEER